VITRPVTEPAVRPRGLAAKWPAVPAQCRDRRGGLTGECVYTACRNWTSLPPPPVPLTACARMQLDATHACLCLRTIQLTLPYWSALSGDC
jgi:hypothetical protein